MAKKSGSISTGSLEVVKKVASLDRNAIKQGINEIFHHDTFHQKYKPEVNNQEKSQSYKQPSWMLSPKWLLACLCFSAIVQGMIPTNVVISSIERRFHLQSTQSGIIAGSYDFGSLLAVIPVTYLGGRPGASKPKYIALGMFIMGTGSLLFVTPHFITDRYSDVVHNSGLDIVAKSSAINASSAMFCQRNSSSIVNSKCDQAENSDDSGIHNHPSLSHFQYVFIAAQILHGIGAAALTTLGTTLVDESLPRKTAPLYIGIFEASFVLGPAIGYVVGGRLLNVYTEFYLDEPTDLPVDSPNWIGAWWLGFIVIFGLSYIAALLLLTFPRILPSSPKKNKKADLINNDYYQLMKELPQALYGLVRNATFMFISLGATMDGFLLAGMAAFLPKYFESQFQLSPGDAAMLVGIIVVPAGAGGTILGGYVAKRLKLDRAGTIKMYIICQTIVIPLYLGFFLYCPNGSFSGLNTPESKDFYNDCNSDCACSLQDYNPVCLVDNQMTFYSPCFAGCQAITNVDNSSHLLSCSCSITNERNYADVTPNGNAMMGVCEDSKCQHLYFSLFLFCQVFFTFAATMPGLVASLRSVEHSQRSLSLGLQTILLRGLGTVPGPIIFGYVMDRTCLLWRTPQVSDCDREDTASADAPSGSCLIYHNFSMTVAVFVICVVWRLAGAIFFAAALYFNRTCSVPDHEEGDDLHEKERTCEQKT